MPLTKQDKEWIKSAIRETVADVITPLDRKVNLHEMTIFGPDGKNGLYGETKGLEKDMGQIKLRMAWIAGGISAGLFAVKEIALKLLTGKT